MSGRRLRYADAVKLLGGQTPEIKALDNLLGGALGLATAGGSEVALSFFDAKGEMIRLGHLVTDRLTEKVLGLGRFDRTMRLQAAHGVLVVTAFFEAVDATLTAAGLEDPRVSRDEEMSLAGAAADGDWLRRLLSAALPVPTPELTVDDLRAELVTWFTAAGDRVLGFVTGLAVFERTDPGVREEVRFGLESVAPLALRRFDEAHLRLAAEISEFALWTDRLDGVARHRELRRSLAGLEDFLTRTCQGADPQRHRAELALTYRAELNEPVAEGDAGDVTFPTLAQLYIEPDFRVRAAGSRGTPADEDWWDVERRGDLGAFLAAYLTTPSAVTAPLLLLGQPGAGKSALTKVLAARLPAADFLAVRVVLREVPAEASIQDQIEHALRGAIGRTVSWPDLAATAGGALPVILLDGFDELLQAAGTHQSDFLTRVAAFQKREATLNRPVAVVVTSRLTAGDRVTLPENLLVARLSGFHAGQVEQWLTTWNAANDEHGRRPLTPAAVGHYPHLVEQPLLLLMLALYDAKEPLGEAAGLELADLYERLMVSFAEREVRRLFPREPESAVPGLIEDELRRLSVMAYAMHNRSRLWVTGAELDADLAELERSPATAQEVVGRFFFLQRAQAVQDGTIMQSYEFLHATFGEYLVARLAVHEIRDGGMLRSLLGYQALFARDTVPTFLHRMLAGRRDAREWLMPVLRAAMTRPSPPEITYRPVDRRIDHWMALYSINLVVLVLACGEPLRASEIFPDEREPAGALHQAAWQWGAAMERSVWNGFLDIAGVRRCWRDDGRDVELVYSPAAPGEPIDPWWTHGRDDGFESAPPGTVVAGFTTSRHIRKSLFLTGSIGDDMLWHALEPLLSRAPESLTTFVIDTSGDRLTSVLHDTVALLAASAHGPETELVRAYGRMVWSVSRAGPVAERLVDLVLSQLRKDAGRLPPDRILSWLSTLAAKSPGFPAAEQVLEVLVAMPNRPPYMKGLVRELLGIRSVRGEQIPADIRQRLVELLAALHPDLAPAEMVWIRTELLPLVPEDLQTAVRDLFDGG